MLIRGKKISLRLQILNRKSREGGCICKRGNSNFIRTIFMKSDTFYCSCSYFQNSLEIRECRYTENGLHSIYFVNGIRKKGVCSRRQM